MVVGAQRAVAQRPQDQALGANADFGGSPLKKWWCGNGPSAGACLKKPQRSLRPPPRGTVLLGGVEKCWEVKESY